MKKPIYLVDTYSFIVDKTAEKEIDEFIATKGKTFEDFVEVSLTHKF